MPNLRLVLYQSPTDARGHRPVLSRVVRTAPCPTIRQLAPKVGAQYELERRSAESAAVARTGPAPRLRLWRRIVSGSNGPARMVGDRIGRVPTSCASRGRAARPPRAARHLAPSGASAAQFRRYYD